MNEDKTVIVGTGLVALDVILNGRTSTPPKISAGGSCGNVLTILSFLGNESFPIARLANNKYTDLLVADLLRWGVDISLISKTDDGSTPVIIHRILRDKSGNPTHRFEFKNPSNGSWLPNYKPVLSKSVNEIEKLIPQKPDFYYFDRVNRASIELAKLCKSKGALIVFEPSSYKDTKQFHECLAVSDILKFSNERIKQYGSSFSDIKVPLEIETLGAAGLNFRFKSNNWTFVESFTIENYVDAAGAGDWCTAGIISKLAQKSINSISSLQNTEIVEALSYGQALGAINCMFDGARGLMYNIEKSKFDLLVRKLIRTNNPSIFDTIKVCPEIIASPKVELDYIFG
jgi:fructokinase